MESFFRNQVEVLSECSRTVQGLHSKCVQNENGSFNMWLQKKTTKSNKMVTLNLNVLLENFKE